MRLLPAYVCCTALIIAAAPVHAQSSLTLYGTVDMGFAYQSHSANDSGTYASASRFAMISGGQSGNRFGIKGKEKVSEKTDINFVLENGFDMGNGMFGQSGRIFVVISTSPSPLVWCKPGLPKNS